MAGIGSVGGVSLGSAGSVSVEVDMDPVCCGDVTQPLSKQQRSSMGIIIFAKYDIGVSPSQNYALITKDRSGAAGPSDANISNKFAIVNNYLAKNSIYSDVFPCYSLFRSKKERVRMNPEGMQTHFKKGVTSLCILSLLARREMYGYELVQEAERVSGGLLSFQEGTLYPVLYRLQERGFITDRKVPVGQRMNRVYYSLTPKGTEYLAQIREEYEAISEGVRRIVGRGAARHETA